MSTWLYWLIALGVGVGLWMLRRQLGVGKILLAALFWPVLIFLPPALAYRRVQRKGRELVRSLPGGSGGITPIRDGETYVASGSPAATALLPNDPAPDINIVIPTFGPIADPPPDETAGTRSP